MLQGEHITLCEQCYLDDKVSGYENKLMTGVVLTGGGSLIKNLKQLGT